MGKHLYYLSLYLSMGFLAGILAASFAWEAAYLAIALALAYRFFHLKGISAVGHLLYIVLLVFSVFLGRGYYVNYVALHDRTAAWQPYYGQTVSFEGIVATEPDGRGASVNVDIAAYRLCLDNACLNVSEKVRLSLPAFPQYHCGDKLWLSGELVQPSPVDTFRYDRYLARYGIYAQMYQPQIRKLGIGHNCQLASFRGSVRRLIQQSMPEPEAGLSAALLLGYRKTVGEAVEQDFSDSGLSHLIAISGTHITLILGLMASLLSALKFSRRQALPVCLAVIITYVALSGFQSSAVRGAIMGGLVAISFAKGHQGAFSLMLSLSATLMLLVNPLLLRDDLGFQMSFLAMAGLGFLFPHIERLYRQHISLAWVKMAADSGVMSLCAFLFIWPVSVQAFGKVAVICLISNIFIAPLFNLFLPAIILACLVACLVPPLSSLAFFFPYLLAKAAIAGAGFFADIPGGYWLAEKMSPAFVCSYYLVLLLVVARFLKKRDRGSRVDKKYRA